MSYFNPEEIWLVNNQALAAERKAAWLRDSPKGLLLRPGLFSFDHFTQRLLEELSPGAPPPVSAWGRRFWLMNWVAENWPFRLDNSAPALVSHLADYLGELWSAWTLAGLNETHLNALSPADWGQRLAEGFQEYKAYQLSLGQADQAGRIRALLAALASGPCPAALKTVSTINVGPVFGLSALEIDLINALRRFARIKITFKIPAWILAERTRLTSSGLDVLLALNALEATVANQSEDQHDLDLLIEPLAEPLIPEALSWAAENLLAFPTEESDSQRPCFADRLVFYEAPEIRDEVRAAARRLRLLLDQGFPPEELALVTPDLELYQPVVAEMAAQYGLPVALKERPLSGSGPARALLGWLDLLDSPWPRLQTAQLLSSPYFSFTSLSPETIYELTLRAGLTDQRAGAEFPDLLLRLPGEQAQQLAQAGQKLLQQAQSMAQAPDWPVFFSLLDDFLTWSGFKGNLGPQPLEQAAGARLLSLLAEAEQILNQAGAPPVNLEFFRFVLDELLAGRGLGFNLGPSGRINFLTYQEAGGRQFTEVFLLGLGERSFPSPSETALPWPESLEEGVTALLGRLRWPGPTEKYRRQEELLGQVIGRTTGRVNLSYSRLNQELRPVLPSPLWGSLRRAAAEPPPIIKISTNPVPLPEDILSLEEMWQVVLNNAALAPDAMACFKAEDQLFGRALLRRRQARLHRLAWLTDLMLAGDGEDETPGRPLISPEGLGGWLGRLKMWEGQAVLSPSQLERYARCPFFFWLSEIINLRPEREPTDDPQASELGSLAHAVLKEFVADQTARGCWPLTDDPQTGKILERIIEEQCLKHQQNHCFGREPVWAVRRENLKKTLFHWLRREAASPAAREFKPILFEWPFGDVSQNVFQAAGGQLGLFEAAENHFGPGRPIPIAGGSPGLALGGRIDRVDLGPTGALVWDYKLTFNDSYPKKLRLGASQNKYFQLAVYTMATGRHLGQASRAGYKYLAGSEIEEAFGPDSTDQILSLKASVRQTAAENQEFNLANHLAKLWDRLRAGFFPPQINDDCSYCAAAYFCPLKEA